MHCPVLPGMGLNPSLQWQTRGFWPFWPMPKGHGFLYERHPLGGVSLLNVRKIWQDRWLVGHPGYGGSTVMFDMEEDVVIAYVSNGLKTGMGELTRTYRMLRNAVFECL